MALPGTIDEWEQDEEGRWSRKGYPEDGVITLTDGFTFADLWAKRLAEDEEPVVRRLVDRRTIIERLAEAGLLDRAEAALSAAPALVRWKWNTAGEGVYFDDPDTVGFLKAIGADPGAILAP